MTDEQTRPIWTEPQREAFNAWRGHVIEHQDPGNCLDCALWAEYERSTPARPRFWPVDYVFLSRGLPPWPGVGDPLPGEPGHEEWAAHQVERFNEIPSTTMAPTPEPTEMLPAELVERVRQQRPDWGEADWTNRDVE